jgi:hypothetical protein
MKQKLFLLLLLVATTVSAQQSPIEIKKGFGGIKLMQNGQVLRPKMVLDIMKSNPDALAEFKKAKSNFDAGQVLGFIGGALIGWPLGTAAGGGDPNWGLAGAGAGLVLVSIPLSVGYKKHATKAVEIYNGNTGATGRIPVKMTMSPYPGGLSLQVRF